MQGRCAYLVEKYQFLHEGDAMTSLSSKQVIAALLLLISFLTMLAPSPECSPGFKAGAPVLRDSEHGEKKVGMPVPKGPNTVQHLSTLYRHTQ